MPLRRLRFLHSPTPATIHWQASQEKPRQKPSRNVPNGVAHIQITFNNTIVSITDSAA